MTIDTLARTATANLGPLRTQSDRNQARKAVACYLEGLGYEAWEAYEAASWASKVAA